MRRHPLLAYREKHHLSQQELADKLHVSRQLIGLIESGERRVSPDNAVEWEAILGIPREVLCPEVFGRKAESRAA